jgi:hypothetical protein
MLYYCALYNINNIRDRGNGLSYSIYPVKAAVLLLIACRLILQILFVAPRGELLFHQYRLLGISAGLNRISFMR